MLPGADAAVVVDVLSFSTTVTVAVEAGIAVWPYRWGDAGAARDFAARQRAVLAAGRSVARPGQVSLSPASIAAAHGITRLVLPSPNGSTIAARLARAGVPVFAASLRNAAAVAGHLGRTGAGVIAIVAAGERWGSGGLRPAVEDLWGAGAVVAGLQRVRGDAVRSPEARAVSPEARAVSPEARAVSPEARAVSPEARAAADAYRAVEPWLLEALLTCASGRELVEGGYRADVELAAEARVSDVVPELTEDGCFR